MDTDAELKSQYDELLAEVDAMIISNHDINETKNGYLSIKLSEFLEKFYLAKHLEWNGIESPISIKEIQTLCERFSKNYLDIWRSGGSDPRSKYIIDMVPLLQDMSMYISLPKQIFGESGTRQRKKSEKAVIYLFFTHWIKPGFTLTANYSRSNSSEYCTIDNKDIKYFHTNNTFEININIENKDKIRGTTTRHIEFCNSYLHAQCSVQCIWNSEILLQAISNPFAVACNVSQHSKAQAALFWYHMAIPSKQSPQHICEKVSVNWDTFAKHLSAFCNKETGRSLHSYKDRLLFVMKKRLLSLEDDTIVSYDAVAVKTMGKVAATGAKSRGKRKSSEAMGFEHEDSLQFGNMAFWKWFYECLKCLRNNDSLVSRFWRNGYLHFGFDYNYTETFLKKYKKPGVLLLRFSITSNVTSIVIAFLNPETGTVEQWSPIAVDLLSKLCILETISSNSSIESVFKLNPKGIQEEQKHIFLDAFTNKAVGRLENVASGYRGLQNLLRPVDQSSTISSVGNSPAHMGPLSPAPPCKQPALDPTDQFSDLKISGNQQSFLQQLNSPYVFSEETSECPCCKKQLRVETDENGRFKLCLPQMVSNDSDPNLNGHKMETNSSNSDSLSVKLSPQLSGIDLDDDDGSDASFELDMKD